MKGDFILVIVLHFCGNVESFDSRKPFSVKIKRMFTNLMKNTHSPLQNSFLNSHSSHLDQHYPTTWRPLKVIHKKAVNEKIRTQNWNLYGKIIAETEAKDDNKIATIITVLDYYYYYIAVSRIINLFI